MNRLNNKLGKYLMLVMAMLLLIMIFPIGACAMEDNSSSVPGNPTYTNDAFYYSDQYMWKVSLFVAKSDTVYLKDGEGVTMDKFYRIGDDAVYVTPVNNWANWMAGKRPASQITNIFYSKDNKVDTLQELNSKGGDVNQLSNVSLTDISGINIFRDPNVPKVPQLNDGDVNDNGVIVKSPDMVGNIAEVKKYFNDDDYAYMLLNYYANKSGKSPEDYMKSMTFTINGETRDGWNPSGLIPHVARDTGNDGTISENTTSQLQWLVVYEPVSIVYVKDTGAAGEAYYGYALTATDFAVMQVKHQMDWRYDETRWTAWAGQQPDAWKPNDQRQHVSRLAFLLMGNSLITEKDWYGLEKSKGYIDQNAAIPNNRWKSDDQIKYGGWGMARLKAPVAAKNEPMDQTYRSDTDVIYSCPIYSNKQAGDGGDPDMLTVTYTINGESFTDKVVAPMNSEAISYFKWHTPKVDTETSYDLKIQVSPFPSATIGNIEPLHTTTEASKIYGGYEYVHQTITVRPLTEITPPDPKVDDTVPVDFVDGLVPPVPNEAATSPDEIEVPKINLLTKVTAPPYYTDEAVTIEVITNIDTEFITLNNLDNTTTKQLTEQAIGQGILQSVTKKPATKEKIWVLNFRPATLGLNHYSVSPTNSVKGTGEPSNFDLEVVEDPDIPTIKQVLIDPVKTLYTLFSEVVPTPLNFDVYFDTEGGTDMDTLSLEYYTFIEKPIDPQKEGYTFAGWFKESSCINPWRFDTDRVEGATTLYAKWDINTYTVSFDTVGGSAVSNQSVQYGESIAKPADPSRIGYSFSGWYQDLAGTQVWNFDQYTVSSDTTLYAKWDNQNFEISFNSQGGTDVDSIIAAYDTTISAPNPPTRVGYSFVGWYKEAACITLWNWATDRMAGDMTLYAKWDLQNYTVTFDTQDGTAVSSQIIQSGSKVVKPVDPQWNGYTFENWFTSDTYDTVWYYDANVVTKDMTLYAKWTANEAKIVFVENGGTEVADLVGATDKTIVPNTMPLIARQGYTFNGWFKAADFSGDVITSLPDRFAIGTTTYYASWTINQYPVVFQENGGDDIPDLTLDYLSKINSAQTLVTRTGYGFAGWFKEPTFENAWDFANDTVTGMVTLYAAWDANNMTVTFHVNGGAPALAPETVKYDTLAAEPSITRYGFSLDGWYTDDSTFANQWDFANDPVLGNVDLYAKWTEDAYILSDLFPDSAMAEAVRLAINENRIASGKATVNSIDEKTVTLADLDAVTSLSGGSVSGSLFFKTVCAVESVPVVGTIHSLAGISWLKNLESLDLSGHQITEIPGEIGTLTNLRNIDLSDNMITTVSATLYQLEDLEALNLADNAVTVITLGIDQMTSLNDLNLSGNSLSDLPADLFDLPGLKTLNVSGNNLGAINNAIGDLTGLITLNISDTGITSLPYGLGNLAYLETLDASYNGITGLPILLKNLSGLKNLNLNNNQMTQLAATVLDGLTGLVTFDVSTNNLTIIPSTIGSLSNLKDLNMSYNNLTGLPDSITALTVLERLNLSGNSSLDHLPLAMGDMTGLTNIWITGTAIDQLPLSIKNKTGITVDVILPYV